MASWAAARDAILGRVARLDHGVVVVLSERGPLRCTYSGRLLGRVAADPAQAPCAGDWCVVQEWPDHRLTVVDVKPRSSTVARPAGALLCANADIVAAVVATRPAPAVSEVRRLVAVARDSGARPLVVLTKTDAAAGVDRVLADVAAVAPGIEVVGTSTVTGAGLARLRDLVGGRRTLALGGRPGQGKSSLTDALVGAEVLPARTARSDGRGAVVRRELVPLPGGGAVIDTPGLPPEELVEGPVGRLTGLPGRTRAHPSRVAAGPA
jgi:ribosome biogenesis GTPase